MSNAETRTPICELEFTTEFGSETILTQLFAPVRRENSEAWNCKVKAFGDCYNIEKEAWGGDAFQALVMGIACLRKIFADLNVEYTSAAGLPEHVFPRFIPSTYGDEKYNLLCAMIDEKIIEWEREMTEKREDRERKRDQSGN